MCNRAGSDGAGSRNVRESVIGSTTSRRKRSAPLGIALDQLCVSDRVCKRVVESARAAFHAQLDWHRRNGPGLRSVG